MSVHEIKGQGIAVKRILEFISKKPAFWQMYLIIIVTVVIIITSLGFIYHESGFCI
jgi:F0F1-type ATP synthase membrane subunit c/vacuolar-type H+-ATPase subunit K